MKPPKTALERILVLARRAAPPPVVPVAPEDARFLAQRTVAEWQRRRATGVTPDPWWLWERVGNWSLAGAAAAWLLVTVLRPEPPPPNPFEAFGPIAAEEFPLF